VKFVPPAGRVVPGRGGAAGVAGARRFLFPERVHNERTGRESERLARRCSPLLLRPRATCCGWGGFFFLSFLLFAVTDAPRRRPRRLLERKKATGRGRREKDEEVLAKPPPSMDTKHFQSRSRYRLLPLSLSFSWQTERERERERMDPVEHPGRLHGPAPPLNAHPRISDPEAFAMIVHTECRNRENAECTREYARQSRRAR